MAPIFRARLKKDRAKNDSGLETLQGWMQQNDINSDADDNISDSLSGDWSSLHDSGAQVEYDEELPIQMRELKKKMERGVFGVKLTAKLDIMNT